MFKIEYIKNNQFNHVKLVNSDNSCYAKIYLNQGASVQELHIDNTPIIEDLEPLQYADTYASSILFPFANRIKDGSYTFQNKAYQFDINQKEENNALHGLVYNKTFKVINEEVSKSKATLKLEYNEVNKSNGFPYKYTIQLIYILSDKGLKLNVQIKNTDSKPFPFTIGWHPYFISKDLYNSSLQFVTSKKVVLGDRMITTGVEDVIISDMFEIKDQKLDDCYILDGKIIKFYTPNYDLEMKASSHETFLQMYTPPRANTIAIEPTTGVSDSFNNKIGLQVLEPNKTYEVEWEINLKLKN